MTTIINGRPPNFEAIFKAFPGAAAPGVVFAYAPYIYAPGRTKLAPQIVAHEEAHIARQLLLGVEEWWKQYFASATFRYFEELIGHRAEYQWLCDNAPNRNARRAALKQIAKKLSSPLYGRLITPAKAAQDLQEVL